MTRLRMASEFACSCGTLVTRDGESTRQWAARSRCTLCEREHLKARIRAATVIDGNGCWLWQRSIKNGYGQISVNDRSTATHRLSYQLFVGPIPSGMRVCHTCDVMRCNNPKHFFLGTQLDNVRDMWQKGRAKKPPTHWGEAHPKVTLTDVQVAEIRARAGRGEKQRDIAQDYGCSQSTVWRFAHQITRASA